jgi:hypothetical protein
MHINDIEDNDVPTTTASGWPGWPAFDHFGVSHAQVFEDTLDSAIADDGLVAGYRVAFLVHNFSLLV